MSTISPAEYLALIAKPKRPKYGNLRTSVDGKRFDSAAEARQYGELLIREKAGEISGLDCQTRFPLKAPNGEVIAVYVADFSFWDHTVGRSRVIDVKGGKATQTPVFKLKQKMMRALLGIEVEVVGKGVK